MDISTASTQPHSVLPPPLTAAPRLATNRRHRWWGVLLAAPAIAATAAVVVGSFVPVDRWSIAPGGATEVNELLVVGDGVETYDTDGKILFLTVSNAHLTGLQATLGWIDPDVDEQTRRERFGDQTPEQNRQINLQAMRTSRNDAPYVALTKLGYPTSVEPGAVIIERIECVKASEDRRECLEFVPSHDFLQPGDELLTVDGLAIGVGDDIGTALSDRSPGDLVEVAVRRVPLADGTPGAEETGVVELTSAGDDEPDRAVFGIWLADTSIVTLPFAVDIDSGQVGGPSAGLAFALAVMDELTPGDLAGGQPVAITGTISVRGDVGIIGGVRQKAVAAKQAGATAMLLPADQSPEEFAEAQAVFGADRVFPVRTFDEAIAALAELGGNGLSVGTPGVGYQG